MAYSDEDLNSAVASGVLTPEAVSAFRSHVAEQRHVPPGGEENFRLINSFNDIFVAIGVVIMLVAAAAIGQAIAGAIFPVESWAEFFHDNVEPTDADWDEFHARSAYQTALATLLGGILVAFASWPLAEFFTGKRRMALPSILLLLAFVGGTFAAVIGAGQLILDAADNDIGGFLISVSGLIAAGAAYLHWRRFMVPITVAAGAGAIAITVVAFITATIDYFTNLEPEDVALALVFIAGLIVFAIAMRWDVSDRERVTRRSDVAFWLHLLAAPMIAHPVFYSLGVMESGSDSVGVGGAIAVLAIYVVFGLVALAIDRRALLVSALAYVLVALAFLFERFGAVELNFALTALIIGSALLTLSAFWAPIRSAIVEKLPGNWQARLPAVAAA